MATTEEKIVQKAERQQTAEKVEKQTTHLTKDGKKNKETAREEKAGQKPGFRTRTV